MKKLVKILTVILSGMLVFSLFGCKPASEDTPAPEPDPSQPKLTIASDYDHSGTYDGIGLFVWCYRNYVKIGVTVDAAFAYAVSGATYHFCYAITEVNSDGEETTKSGVTPEKDFDRLWGDYSTIEDRRKPYRHTGVPIQCIIKLLRDGEKMADDEYGLYLEEAQGTIALEFNLNANGNDYTHRVMVDYSVVDNEIEYKQLNEWSDYLLDKTLDNLKSTEGESAMSSVLDPIAAAMRRQNYYRQEMNAGKGYFNWWYWFSQTGEKQPDMILSVNGFSGYFDPNSPLTDLYIGFGCTRPAYVLWTQNDEFPANFASLVITTRAMDKNGNVTEEKSRNALDFTVADKRNHIGWAYERALRMNERRGVVKEDDFIGEQGEIEFKLVLSDPERWEEIKETKDSVMYYQKKDGKTYIGLSRQGLGE